jgi:hypothetical protein
MNAFDSLTFTDKTELLRKGGEIIITVTTSQHYVSLYVLDNFLVERYYNIETKVIDQISTSDGYSLDKYLNHISINEVYGLLL